MFEMRALKRNGTNHCSTGSLHLRKKSGLKAQCSNEAVQTKMVSCSYIPITKGDNLHLGHVKSFLHGIAPLLLQK